MYAITRKATYRRSLIIFILVTFLFLPFSKPKKAQAFPLAIPAIPWVAEAFLSIGATYMVCSGVYNFVNGIQLRHEAKKLMQECSGDLLFHCEEFDTWWTYEQMDADNWKKWDKKVKQKPGKETPTKIYGAIGSIIKNAIELGKGEEQQIEANFPVKLTIDSYGEYVIEVVGDKYYSYDSMNTLGCFQSSSESYKMTNKSHTIKANFSLYQGVSPWQSHSKISEESKYGNSAHNIVVSGGGPQKLPYTKSYPEGVKVNVNTNVLYKENLLENANEETFKQNTENKVIDVSKVENVPSTATKPSEIPNLEITEDTNTDTGTDEGVDTGWKWLDNILNSILNAIKSIQDFFKARWEDIVNIKDFLLSIPSQISSWWEGLWTDVPALDFTPLTSVEISKVFPFSIPFDLKNLLEILLAEPRAPVFDIPLWTEKITLDLTKFNLIADIVRVFCILGWSFYLINRHKQMEE